jgi:hypothetical protein
MRHVHIFESLSWRHFGAGADCVLVAAPELRRFARDESGDRSVTVWTSERGFIANAPKCIASPSVYLRFRTQPFCARIVDVSSI